MFGFSLRQEHLLKERTIRYGIGKKGGLVIETLSQSIYTTLLGPPARYAYMQGSEVAPDVTGVVTFYRYRKGSIVVTDIAGLPTGSGRCESRVFGCHIHEGSQCTGTERQPYLGAGGHFNIYDCPHPYHAGDLPNLFENRGSAWNAFFTERFTPEEVLGRTVIIHEKADDYTSQPTGDAGEVLACGVIV